MSNEVNIRPLHDGDPVWDQVGDTDLPSIYHRREWIDVVQSVFGHVAKYHAVLRNDKLVDILPLFMVRYPLLGSKFVSTPYDACFGGLISRDSETQAAIVQEAMNEASRYGARYIEIRSQDPILGSIDLGFSERTPFLASEVCLRDHESNWKMLSSNHRRNVRAAKNNGVEINAAFSKEEMRQFYRIIVSKFRSIGIPFPSRFYFDQIWNLLITNGHAQLLLARKNKAIIGGHLLFFSGNTLISKYSATRLEKHYRKLYTSYALFWEAIRLGIDNGFQSFNLGITGRSHTGLLDFKERFGAQTRDSRFYYCGIQGKVPDFSKYYDGYRVLKYMWRFVPGPLASLIGHQINRWIC